MVPKPLRRVVRRAGVTLALVVAATAVATLGPGLAGAARQPLPAGRDPSQLAKMPCQPKAQREIADALGVSGTVVDDAWVHHRYSCLYRYPTGAFTLSIQELSSWPQTLSYYRSLGKTFGDAQSLRNLGQGAFQTRDGSVVVRKDWKVLLVNVASLPPTFGVPATSSGDVAVTVADVILGCWSGD